MLKSSISECFAKRRKQLSESNPDAAFLLPSHPEYIRNNDVFHSYRQDSNLVYLTGFEEPESWALILPKGRYYLFVREKNAEKEIWDGERYGVDGAKEVFGPTEAHSIAKFDELVPKLLDGVKRLYYPLGRNQNFRLNLGQWGN